MARMISRGYKAEYFVNIFSLAEQPNSYNAGQYIAPQLDPEYRKALRQDGLAAARAHRPVVAARSLTCVRM